MSLFSRDETNVLILEIITNSLKHKEVINRDEIIEIILSEKKFLFKDISSDKDSAWIAGNMVDWFSSDYTTRKLSEKFLDNYVKEKEKIKGREISCFKLSRLE